jgi:integral membrane protein
VSSAQSVQTSSRPSYAGALLRYRVMAYATGVVLITATIMLILQKVFDLSSIDTPTGLLWVLHGYLFLVYVITALHLGIKLRWHLVRLGLVIVAGTIPLLSFVAERLTTRYVAEQAASGGRGSSAQSPPPSASGSR